MVQQMFGRNNTVVSVLLSSLLLVACGSAPEKPNLPSEQANTLSARADAAFLQGEYERAADDYLKALRISQSVENIAEIAILRYNLARALRESGRPESAHQHLDALFSEPVLPYPPSTLAAAAALKSQLYLEGGELISASRWLEKGEELCQSKCAAAGSLLLLSAQLAQREGRPDEARKFAEEAISALNSGRQQIELANAHRLSGEISMQANDLSGAYAAFQKALAIDQKSGAPGKIRLDLLRLGMAYERAGEASTALHYYHRALSVSEAIGTAKGTGEVRVLIQNLQGTPETRTTGPR